GRPTPVERVMICPPESRIGPLSDSERSEHLSRSPLKGRYDTVVDRESAYELLKQRADVEAKSTASTARSSKNSRGPGRPRQSVLEAMTKSAVRSIGSSLGRQIVRGILGSLLGKSR
ncbi:MAG: ATP-binding protein, partial [Gammaproteobacteria bacterium SG8_11]